MWNYPQCLIIPQNLLWLFTIDLNLVFICGFFVLFCPVEFVSQFMIHKFLLLYGDLFVILVYFCNVIMLSQNQWNMLFTAGLGHTLDCEDLMSSKIIFCLQIFQLIFWGIVRCLEVVCYGYLNNWESDWGIIGNQAVLFCDLHFPHRYDICLMTPGVQLIMLLAAFALFCILQMLHPVVLSFMPLLRHKMCGVCCILCATRRRWRWLSQVFLSTTTSVLCDNKRIT